MKNIKSFLVIICSLIIQFACGIYESSRWTMMSTSIQEFVITYPPIQDILDLHLGAYEVVIDKGNNMQLTSDEYDSLITSELRSILSESALPTYMPPPKDNSAPIGYIYFQYFDDLECGVNHLISESGLGLDSCLSYPDTKLSYRVGLIDPENCSQALVVSYYNAGCDERNYIGQFPLDFSTECVRLPDNTSFAGFCHNSPTIPKNFRGYLEAGYEGDVTCSAASSPTQYVNTPTDSCFFGVSPQSYTFPFPSSLPISVPQNSTWDSYSYKYLCDSNIYADGENVPENYTVALYWNSFTCDDSNPANVQLVYVPASCDIEDLEFPFAPSPFPSSFPTSFPTNTKSPTLAPSTSLDPTFSPTESPTISDTLSPTESPTESPTYHPTIANYTDSPTIIPTELPSSQPSSRPTMFNESFAPSIEATMAPTVWAHSLEYYYAQAAFQGTIKRSCVYTYQPTLQPTPDPTVASTAEPTADSTLIPSARPTTYPRTRTPTRAPTFTRIPTFTRSPTLTSVPTIQPTRIPSQKPTVLPTIPPSMKPTWMPASTPVVILDIIQRITGLNATLFNSPLVYEQYRQTLEAAIVQSLYPSISASDIYDLLVVAYTGSSSTSTLATMPHLAAATVIAVQATVSYSLYVPTNTSGNITSNENAASSLSTKLNAAVATGAFNNYLTEFAIQYNASGLINTTTSSMSITNVSPSASPSGNNSSEWWSTGINFWILISAGGALCIILLVLFVYCTFYRSKNNSGRESNDIQAIGIAMNTSSKQESGRETRLKYQRTTLNQQDDDDLEYREDGFGGSAGNPSPLTKVKSTTSASSPTESSFGFVAANTTAWSTANATKIPAKNNYHKVTDNNSSGNANAKNSSDNMVVTTQEEFHDPWFSFDDAFSSSPNVSNAPAGNAAINIFMNDDFALFNVEESFTPTTAAPPPPPPPPPSYIPTPPATVDIDASLIRPEATTAPAATTSKPENIVVVPANIAIANSYNQPPPTISPPPKIVTKPLPVNPFSTSANSSFPTTNNAARPSSVNNIAIPVVPTLTSTTNVQQVTSRSNNSLAKPPLPRSTSMTTGATVPVNPFATSRTNSTTSVNKSSVGKLQYKDDDFDPL